MAEFQLDFVCDYLKNYFLECFKKIVIGGRYICHWLPSKDKSGGILGRTGSLEYKVC
jgi:hypothetical protein